MRKEHSTGIVTLRLELFLCDQECSQRSRLSQGGETMLSFLPRLQWPLIWHPTLLFPQDYRWNTSPPPPKPSPKNTHLLLQSHSSIWKGSLNTALTQSESKMAKSPRMHFTGAGSRPSPLWNTLSPFHTLRSPGSWPTHLFIQEGFWK